MYPVDLMKANIANVPVGAFFHNGQHKIGASIANSSEEFFHTCLGVGPDRVTGIEIRLLVVHPAEIGAFNVFSG